MTRRIRLARWDSAASFAGGRSEGTAVRDGRLVLDRPTGRREHVDPHRDGAPVAYEEGTWTSPPVTPGFPVAEVVPSWNARTPAGTWLEVALLATLPDGTATGRYLLGRWAETDRDVCPSSVPGQADEHATVDVDRLLARPGRPFAAYRLQVSLLRRAGTAATPEVTLLGAMAADPVPGADRPVPHTGPSAAVTEAGGLLVEVPAYSQQRHRGAYPQWGNGGESWCSPTSVSMVLHHWGLGPDPAEYAWVDPDLPDRFVAYAARHTFDHAYRGPGNWSFNTAYAARFGVSAFVTRLRSLREAEAFLAVGIPLVVSTSFTAEQLTGAGYGTEGHLLVVVGVDPAGNVVCHDPASHGVASNAEVRTTYDRAEFERAWLGRADGLTYVVRPPGVPLPTPPAEANW